MKGTLSINVILWDEVIGKMVWDNTRQVATFQFSKRYHEMPYNLMPTRPMKPIPAFFGTIGDKYHGLPPFIADSLPDHWGSVIFDKWAKEKGLQPEDCNPLLKLAYIGKRGLGALEFVPEVETGSPEAGDLSDLEAMAQEIYRKRSEVVIKDDDKTTFESFARLGSPPGGAHSKILIAISDNDSSIISGQMDPEEGFTQYILKFNEDYDVPSCEIEYVYYLMAKEAGIDMMPSRLIEINGRRHFLTKRFDRRDGRKLLTQTMAALIPSASDYQNLFFLCRTLGLEESARVELFRRMCFNVIAGNTDDHNKNFSFIMQKDGSWRLSPAYDITYITDNGGYLPNEDHCLYIRAKLRNVTREDVILFAHDNGIRRPDSIIRDVVGSLKQFRSIATKYGVSERWTGRVEATIIGHMKAWGEWEGEEQTSDLTINGHLITDFHLEQQFKGNDLLLATIDGKELKYIIRKGTPEHEELTRMGLANITEEMKKELVERFLLPKIDSNV